MGVINHGNQDMTYEYYEEATAEDFNKRHLENIPRGIYQGGHLKRVTDSKITLSPLIAEIGDDDAQISVKTSEYATLESPDKLDSGSISFSTPYIILRWNFLEQTNNYVEVHAIANVAAALDNDIIVGKCKFVDEVLQEEFDYTDRTLLNVQSIFLRVEPTEDSEMKVWVRGGRIHTATQCVIVPEQKFDLGAAPGSPNSRIDLIYIDIDGTVKRKYGSQGTSPVVPGYENKLVIAEVKLVNGETNIIADRITDVRSFLTSKSSIDVYASIYASSAQSIISGSGLYVKIIYDSVIKDSTGNIVDLVNNRLKPDVAGWYVVTLVFRMENMVDNDQLGIVIRKNGVNVAFVCFATNAISGVSDPGGEASALVYLNGLTDYVEAWVGWQESGTKNSLYGLLYPFFLFKVG